MSNSSMDWDNLDKESGIISDFSEIITGMQVRSTIYTEYIIVICVSIGTIIVGVPVILKSAQVNLYVEVYITKKQEHSIQNISTHILQYDRFIGYLFLPSGTCRTGSCASWYINISQVHHI